MPALLAVLSALLADPLLGIEPLLLEREGLGLLLVRDDAREDAARRRT